MTDKYILIEGKPTPEPDLLTWARWFEKADRSVAKDAIGDVEVSTVFLGMDHSLGSGKPLLYETMIFGGPLDGEQERYATEEEARAGHASMLERVKGLPA